jgi:hypothetical protein
LSAFPSKSPTLAAASKLFRARPGEFKTAQKGGSVRIRGGNDRLALIRTEEYGGLTLVLHVIRKGFEAPRL